MAPDPVKLRKEIARFERKLADVDEEMDILEVRLMKASGPKKKAIEKKIEKMDVKFEKLDVKITTLKKQLAECDPTFKPEDEEDEEDESNTLSEDTPSEVTSSPRIPTASAIFADQQPQRQKNPIAKDDSSTRDELQKALEIGANSEPSSLANSWKLEDLDDVATSLSLGTDDVEKALADMKLAADETEPETKNSDNESNHAEEKEKEILSEKQEDTPKKSPRFEEPKKSSELTESKSEEPKPSTEKKEEIPEVKVKSPRFVEPEKPQKKSPRFADESDKEKTPQEATKDTKLDLKNATPDSSTLPEKSPREKTKKEDKKKMHEAVTSWLGDTTTTKTKKSNCKR